MRGGPDREELERLYHHEKMSLAEIARRFDTTEATVSRWMAKRGITTRTAGATKFLRWGCPESEILEDMYLRRQMSTPDMAVYFGVQPATIMAWLQHYGIKRRSLSEAAVVAAKQGKRTQYKKEHPTKTAADGWSTKWRKAPTAYLPEYNWPLSGEWQVRTCYDWSNRRRIRQWVYLLM